MTTLIFFYIYILIHCDSQPVFECPKQVAYGRSANLTCYNINPVVSIITPAGRQVAACISGTCASFEDWINITSIDSSTVLLTVREIDKEDEGEWTCLSGERARCSLHVYKLPSCEISSTSSTNDLTIGQDLTLIITLSDYYCTNSIACNLHIGGSYQNITELRDQEETDDITSRVVTYSPVVTSSLTGRVELAYNCNDETYDISCTGVEELKLRGVPGGTSNNLVLFICLPVGVILLVAILGILIAWKLKRCKSSRNDTPLYDVPNHDTNIENRYQDLILNDDSRQQAQEMQNSPDVVYETPQQEIKTQNSSRVQYENIENVEQAQNTKGIEVQYGNINSQSENGNQEYLSAVFERP